MSYEKQEWANGDIITADKLNHMEDGIASGGGLVLHATDDSAQNRTVLDRTWQEINDAFVSGMNVVVAYGTEEAKALMETYNDGSTYKLQFGISGDGYDANSPDDYPFMPWQ